MTYFNQFHKEKTERCLKKMKAWYTKPLSSEEVQEIVKRMYENLRIAQEMEKENA